VELRTLRIRNLRLIEQLSLQFGSRWNLLVGPNGAGKTSVLEAAYLLSHGRSFRTAAKDVLVRHGSNGYSVYGEVLRETSTAPWRVGVSRDANRLEARLNGETVAAGELLRTTAVLCFEPGSHALISGPSEERRRFLDWGVFHVEHDFLVAWRRYQRALKQRNAWLRSTRSDAGLDVWDHELVSAADGLTRMRNDYFQAWQPIAADLLRDLLGELGEPRLHFHPGFDASQSLATVLAAQRSRDLARGHTGAGPHRADWSVMFADTTRREHLSRGQEKLCAFACVMAQAQLFANIEKEWPVLCLDDVSSEIDDGHQRRLLDMVDASGAQILATATHVSRTFEGMDECAVTRFHVEQGDVTRLL
jgi:DNA replication and repair protein RecF